MRKRSEVLKHLTDFLGDGVRVKESPKSKAKKEMVFFVTLLDLMLDLDARSNLLLEQGINLIDYEDPYYQIIEGLILRHYGEAKAGLIAWWLLEKQTLIKKNLTLKTESGKEFVINTPRQLYMVLKKLKV